MAGDHLFALSPSRDPGQVGQGREVSCRSGHGTQETPDTLSCFEWCDEVAGHERSGEVGEPGELCVVLSHARYKI